MPAFAPLLDTMPFLVPGAMLLSIPSPASASLPASALPPVSLATLMESTVPNHPLVPALIPFSSSNPQPRSASSTAPAPATMLPLSALPPADLRCASSCATS